MKSNPETWWYDAFPVVQYQHKPPGASKMLYVIAYDISDDRRLTRIARICQDYGVRVQYSVFECYLDEKTFQHLWEKLKNTIDPDQDRIVAYKLDAQAVRQIVTAGRMVCSERVVCYLV